MTRTAAATQPFAEEVGPHQQPGTATPRGWDLCGPLRRARNKLEKWDIPYDSTPRGELTLIVAELAANAVQHGRVPGRDFRLAMTAFGPTVRVEVTDTRPECVPVASAPSDDCDSGRGLLLVAALAARWGWRPRQDGPGKTVWAEYQLLALQP